MRILIITDQFPPAHFGGMAQHAFHVAEYLSQRHAVLVATLLAHDSSVHATERFSVRPLLTKRFPRYDFRLIRRLARSFKADVIHACTAGLVNEVISCEFPVVTRTVGNDFLRPWCGYNLPLRSILYRLPGKALKASVRARESAIRMRRVCCYLKAGATTVANSGWTRDRLTEIGVPSARIRVVVGGLNTETFRPADDKAAVRHQLGLPVDAPVITTAGNLIKKKGFDTVLHALARLQQNARPQYVLIGDGPEEQSLRRLAAELGLQDLARFVARKTQTELAKYYQASDVYVLTSQEESMGRTYFEAGACGVPVVGARVGGVPDVVRHGDNGLLVDDPEDVEAIAECVQRLLADDAMRARMGAAGLKRARQEFSWEQVGAEYEDIIRAVAKRRIDDDLTH